MEHPRKAAHLVWEGPISLEFQNKAQATDIMQGPMNFFDVKKGPSYSKRLRATVL